MTVQFVDTAFFVAYVNPRDRHHAKAAHIMCDAGQHFLTSQWVLAESANYLSKTGRAQFAELERLISSDSRFHILPADDASFREAIELYNQRTDKQWSFTDCTSFCAMTTHSIRAALTTDHHFEQAGFSVLLR